MILPQLGWRMMRTASLRTLWKLGLNCGLANVRAIRRFQKGLKAGEVFPPFLFLSITNKCNLHCQGCWVAVDAPKTELSLDEVAMIIAASRKRNCRFFGILGGEPLLHEGRLEIFGRHRDCTFQLFTNGTLITPEFAREMRKLGNVTPLISIEGGASVSDIRRGGSDVLARSLAGLENCTREKLFTGVATSVCKSNLDELCSEAWLDELIRRRALYAWYYLYRPAGENPCVELALDADEITRVRRFLVEQRCKKPIMIVDSYWDGQGRALCPAAVGISHHVSPGGWIEPCPPIQFARDHIHDNDDDLVKTLTESSFLASFRKFAAEQTRGCVLLDCPGKLADFLDEQGARDTSLRGASSDDLRALPNLPCHHIAGEEIPEKHWMYRFAKKHWFFGFGAYG